MTIACRAALCPLDYAVIPVKAGIPFPAVIPAKAGIPFPAVIPTQVGISLPGVIPTKVGISSPVNPLTQDSWI